MIRVLMLDPQISSKTVNSCRIAVIACDNLIATNLFYSMYSTPYDGTE